MTESSPLQSRGIICSLAVHYVIYIYIYIGVYTDNEGARDYSEDKSANGIIRSKIEKYLDLKSMSDRN